MRQVLFYFVMSLHVLLTARMLGFQHPSIPYFVSWRPVAADEEKQFQREEKTKRLTRAEAFVCQLATLPFARFAVHAPPGASTCASS